MRVLIYLMGSLVVDVTRCQGAGAGGVGSPQTTKKEEGMSLCNGIVELSRSDEYTDIEGW